MPDLKLFAVSFLFLIEFAWEPLTAADDAEVARLLPQMLEGEADPLDFERVFAHVAFAGLDDALAASVVKRARSVSKIEYATEREILRSTAAALVIAWVDQIVDFYQARLPWPLGERVRQVLDLAAKHTTGVVLWATPTDTRGCLGSAALAARAKANANPSEADLAGALLRLDFEGRGSALLETSDGTGLALDALHYALGGDPAAIDKASIVRNPKVWVAAARARDPFGDDQLLIASGLDGQGLGRAQRVELTQNTRYWGDRNQYHATYYGIDTVVDSDAIPAMSVMPLDAARWRYVDDLLVAPV
ncbi:MAG: hypothetical protein FWG47_05870, partial [Propionibacteriaceae bacterium]|nr:hypothetical protein [Propionibacteriaceae bacterium]